MKAILLATTFLVVAMAAVAQDLDVDAMSNLTSKYIMSIQVGTPGTPSHRFVYTNNRARLFVYKIEDGKLKKDWETVDLGSKAASMFVTDLYGDGTSKLVVATIRGRLLIYDFATYDLEWENLQDGYTSIDYMSHANLDDDPQEEIVIIADRLIYIFDGLNRNIQWVSDTEFQAKMFVIGNVDDDPQDEIILNTGRVIDTRFYNIEFEADGQFGERITLFDINMDGYPDVFGEFSDFSIRVYDVWAQRELW